jgi:hypothetical protein
MKARAARRKARGEIDLPKVGRWNMTSSRSALKLSPSLAAPYSTLLSTVQLVRYVKLRGTSVALPELPGWLPWSLGLVREVPAGFLLGASSSRPFGHLAHSAFAPCSTAVVKTQHTHVSAQPATVAADPPLFGISSDRDSASRTRSVSTFRFRPHQDRLVTLNCSQLVETRSNHPCARSESDSGPLLSRPREIHRHEFLRARMHASDAPSCAAHHIRRRPAAILRDAFEWRKTAKVAYSEARAGAADAGMGGSENARRPATRRPREQHRLAEAYDKDLEYALEQRLAETIPSPPRYREGAGVDPDRRSSKRRRPLKGSEPNWNPAQPVRHYSTDSSFVLNDDGLRARPPKLAKRGAETQRTAIVSEWSTLEPDCSAPRIGYTPSHALYIAMICQGRKEMSPAYPPPVETERLLFERAVPESAANISVTSSAVAASISTAPRRSPTSTRTVRLASSSGLRTSTRPRVQPAVTPLAKAVETAGLTPQQAEQAQRAALQSYVDSAFSAAASKLDNPAGTTTSSPTSSSSSANPSPSSSSSRYMSSLFLRALSFTSSSC